MLQRGTDDANVTMAVAVDMDNGAVYFARNNTYINSGDPTSGSSKTGAIATDLLTDNNGDHVIAVHGYNGSNSYGLYANFGQQPFTYTHQQDTKHLIHRTYPTQQYCYLINILILNFGLVMVEHKLLQV